MPDSDGRGVERALDRPRPPSVERLPTLTEVVDLPSWMDAPVLAAAQPAHAGYDVATDAGDDAWPFEATTVLPPGAAAPALDLTLDLAPVPPADGAADLPDLAGLSLDSGAAWPPAADEPPLHVVAPQAAAAAAGVASAGWQGAGAPPPAPVDAAALVSRVLDDLAPRIDLLLQQQLRDALTPALQRAADALVLDVREQLGAALRTLVEQAVTRTLQQPDGS